MKRRKPFLEISVLELILGLEMDVMKQKFSLSMKGPTRNSLSSKKIQKSKREKKNLELT
jgi:hypothetical protein